ncbi:beta-galactosidase [Agaribacterium haliotis]|uniref:beta-galactosidase n=1 Tax=Agaribacterium haliotis TaxID=2013869 RepID=UPI001EFD9D2F|nr:beta-galactosidase [Agaribacterium haliotis]
MSHLYFPNIRRLPSTLAGISLSAMVAAAGLSLTGCQNSESKPQTNNGAPNNVQNSPDANIEAKKLSGEKMLADFDNISLRSAINSNNATTSIVSGKQAISGEKSLLVHTKTRDHNSAALNFEPNEAWDWSQYQDFHLAFDIANFGDESVDINLDISDIDGNTYTRAFVAPVGVTWTWYAKMDGHDQKEPAWASDNEFNFESGLRSNPPTWQGDHQVFSLWGKKHLNLKGITKISFSVKGMLSDRQFTIDNLRLRPNPKMDKNFLSGLIDEFGQNNKVDYPGKIHSLEQLHQARDKELAELSDQAFPGRSKFNGWADGPRYEATGNFRTEKINGKWWLIDPEGYLYLSTGIDILRLSNSSTLTGYDFDQKFIPKRHGEMLISEDDQPLNRVSDDALPSRKLVSQTRADIFKWLPSYDDELGNHFGYRRETQSGPLKHGETYSFYSANLERKYGESSPESYLQSWREITLKRMQNWGYSSLGNWAQEEFYSNTKMPYVAFADIIGDFGTLSSGFDFWHGVPDPWDPLFKTRAEAAVDGVAKQIKNSPWCMGIFLDNEQSFGRLETDELHYGIVYNTLKEDAAKVYAKAEFTRMMKNKYGDINKLNKAWGKNLASWDEFAKGVEPSFNSKQQKQDYSAMLYAYGDQYFGTVKRALKQRLPNHLYLGSRLPVWGMPIEIVQSGSKHMDIITFNLYEEGLVPSEWAFMQDIDAPALIGEFSFGSFDAGHVHPGIVISSDQEDRGRMYKSYMYSVIDHPSFIGAHMFQYMDSPIPGRAYDGENYNNGMVAVTDIPYAPLVQAAKEVHAEMYQRRWNKN